jgi:hypothetical protein
MRLTLIEVLCYELELEYWNSIIQSNYQLCNILLKAQFPTRYRYLQILIIPS